MLRFLRHVSSLMTILCALVFIATVVLWVRSHRFSEMISWRNAHGSRSIRSASGCLVIDWLSADWSPNPTFFQPLQYERGEVHPAFNYFNLLGGSVGDIDTHWERAGFEWHEKRNPGRQTLLFMLVIPFWALAAVSLLVPVTFIAAQVRRRQRRVRMQRAGLCLSCGYDRRATPQGRVCPECGEAAEQGVSY